MISLYNLRITDTDDDEENSPEIINNNNIYCEIRQRYHVLTVFCYVPFFWRGRGVCSKTKFKIGLGPTAEGFPYLGRREGKE